MSDMSIFFLITPQEAKYLGSQEKFKYQKHACFGFNTLKTFDKDFK